MQHRWSNQGCGVHELSFHISNYTGFSSNDWKSPDGSIKEIYYAADILYAPLALARVTPATSEAAR